MGKERQKTYSPFLPICPETGQVLEVPIIEIKKKEGKIIYKNGDKKIETEVINGKCKLQWKVDWAMRWYAFDVDYEMYGKDLIESALFFLVKFVKFWEKKVQMVLLMKCFWMKKVKRFLNLRVME